MSYLWVVATAIILSATLILWVFKPQKAWIAIALSLCITLIGIMAVSIYFTSGAFFSGSIAGDNDSARMVRNLLNGLDYSQAMILLSPVTVGIPFLIYRVWIRRPNA